MERLTAVCVLPGTYRCDVQDAQHRRMKRIYWGIRVLPEGLNLDYDSSVERWNSSGEQQEQSSSPGDILLYSVSFGSSCSAHWFWFWFCNLWSV